MYLILLTCPSFRYNKQHGGVRFGMFAFGPEMMRLFHWLNQPDAAKKVWVVEGGIYTYEWWVSVG